MFCFYLYCIQWWKRFWLDIFEEQHLSYQSKKDSIQFIWTLRKNYISKDFQKNLISAFSIFLNKNWTFQYFANITLNFLIVWLDSFLEKIVRVILYKTWSKLALRKNTVQWFEIKFVKKREKICFVTNVSEKWFFSTISSCSSDMVLKSWFESGFVENYTDYLF